MDVVADRALVDFRRVLLLLVDVDAETSHRHLHLAILRASGNDLLVPLGVLIESAFDNLFTFTTRELDDLQHAQQLHEAIEKAIRLQRPEAARNAVRKLLANTDGVINTR